MKNDDQKNVKNGKMHLTLLDLLFYDIMIWCMWTYLDGMAMAK